jgi:hypothetical protein
MFFAHLKGRRNSAYLSYATDLPGGDCFDRSHRGHTSLSRSTESTATGMMEKWKVGIKNG